MSKEKFLSAVSRNYGQDLSNKCEELLSGQEETPDMFNRTLEKARQGLYTYRTNPASVHEKPFDGDDDL